MFQLVVMKEGVQLQDELNRALEQGSEEREERAVAVFVHGQHVVVDFFRWVRCSGFLVWRDGMKQSG